MEIKDLVGFSEPAKKLLEIISGGASKLYEPTHVKKMAKANAEAKEIDLKKSQELDFKQRAHENELSILEIKYKNKLAVGEKSLKYLANDSIITKPSEDFYLEFSEHSSKIIDEEIQEVWAKILAGEINQPKSFSVKTLKLLSILDKKDLEDFSLLCSTCIYMGELKPIIFDYKSLVYEKFGLTFDLLENLANLGLISFESLSTYLLILSKPDDEADTYNDNFSYAKEVFQIIILKDKFDSSNKFLMPSGNVIFSKTGKELSKLVDIIYNNEILNHALEAWKKEGLEIKRLINGVFV